MATSSATASIITGGSGNDGLLGTSGNDTIDGGGGSDVINAGSGNDTMIYRLGANAGATDIYVGGSGIDTIMLQLTQSEWADAGVRAELARYVSFLGTVSLNSKGEVSGASSNDFVFSFPNGGTLLLRMTEKLAVAVQDSSGQYVLVDHLASVISGPASGSVIEAGGVANAIAGTPSATGDLYADDLNGPDDAFQPVTWGVAMYGTYSITSTGVWTYNLNNEHGSVQTLNVGGTLTDSFTVLAQDGSSQVVTVLINGANDAAVVTGTSEGSVVEAGGLNNGEQGTATALGTLFSSDVDDTDNLFIADPSGGVSTGTIGVVGIIATVGIVGSSSLGSGSFSSSPSMTRSDLGYGSYTVDSQGHWIYTVDNAASDVQALNLGDTLTDTFTVRTADGTEQVVTVTISGADDAAVITGTSTGTVVEAGGLNNATGNTPEASGTLVFSDVDNPGGAFQSASGTAAYGNYAVTAGGTWTYSLNNDHVDVQALNVGGTLTDSFTVLAEDGTAQEVMVTINGANDAAVITGIIEGSVVEAGGLNNGEQGTATVGSVLSSTDVDNPAGDNPDDDFQSASGTAAYGTYAVAYGAWTYSLNNDHVDVQALNMGETLTDRFTVLAQDGTAQEVTVTVIGADDAAVITGTSTGTVVEAGGVNNATGNTPEASGTLVFTDVDNPGGAFQLASGTAAYGTYAVTAGGTWTYSLNNDHVDVQALNVGGTLTDTFIVRSQDNTEQTVTITIQGANDTVTNDIVNHAPTDITLAVIDPGDSPLAAGSTLAILSSTDLDAGDSHSYSIVNGSDVFEISGNSLVMTKDPVPLTHHIVTIRTTDSAGAAFTKDYDVFFGSGESDGPGLLWQNGLLFGGGSADRLTGYAGEDYLFGQAGNDELFGGGGDDWLVGGGGNDTLRGDVAWGVVGGMDMFVFNSPMGSTNVDLILDFEVSQDKIVLENTGAGLFNALADGPLAEGAFVVLGSSTVTADTRIIYTGVELMYDADGSGSIEAVLIAVMGNSPALTFADFLVI